PLATFVDQSKPRPAVRPGRSKPSWKVDRTRSVRKWNRPGICAKTRIGLETPSIELFPGGGWRRYGRGGNQERLPGHQFQRVFDVIEFLQLADTDVVHSRNRGERFTAGDGVAVAIACFRGWFGRRGSGCRCCRGRCRGGTFSNH